MQMPMNTPSQCRQRPLQENFLDIKKEPIKSGSMKSKMILDDS